MPLDITQPTRLEASLVARDAVRNSRGFFQYCNDAGPNIRTNPMSANWVVQTVDVARDTIAACNALALDLGARGDLAYYFETDVPTVNSKFTALRQAAIAVRDWCVNALPKDAQGNLTIQQRDVEGAQTVYRFEIGTLDALADLMDAYVTAARA